MSSVNDSPPHFMVLDAISRGMRSIGKIASVTRMNKAQVEMIVNDLAAQRLIIVSEKKGFFGNKKQEITITETGMRVLMAKKQELEKKFQQFQQWYSNGQIQQMQNSMGSDRMWIPFMLFSGIMNAMFFMSMMSLMGAAMTPAESQFAGDAGGAGADAGAAGADGGGADGGDAGGGGDFGGGDFGF
ncbi:MarR family transcriptional regulator [Nitrososphaera sp.]|uniref:MarR family transcriptional regulator n=1 Tax=Nitrososphaera sp. TaxID=1971748 RepID=UPI00307F9B12